MSGLIERQDAIDAVEFGITYAKAFNVNTGESKEVFEEGNDVLKKAVERLKELPSAQPEGWVKIPDTGIDDMSDGFHTFRQLYYQRMILFAIIVRQNREKAWKSLRHEDGELCFGGGWFIVGVDTPEGSYTYHYEDNFYSLFDCEELDCAKHWDGHTEKDVTRLLSLPSAQPEQRWIPCSERLPESYKDVLVYYEYYKYCDYGSVCFQTYGIGYCSLDGTWHGDVSGTKAKCLAWSPLPEPYKGGEDEK